MSALYDGWGLPIEFELEAAMRRLVEQSTSPSTRGTPMPLKMLVIEPDGTCREVEISDGDDRLPDMQNLIDGFLEKIDLNGALGMYVHEDGQPLDLDLNPLATAIARTSGTPLPLVLRGTALLFGGWDANGDEQSVSDATIEWLRRSQLATWPNNADA